MLGETVQGAGAGAQVGANFGPYGMVIGAIVGGLSGAVFGSKAKRKRKKAERKRKELAFYTNFRQRQAAIRQWQAQEAAILSSAVASGAGIGSSAVQGAKYGLYGSLQEELKYNAINFNMQNQIARYQQSAERTSNLFSSFAGAIGQGAGAFKSMRLPSDPTKASRDAGAGTAASVPVADPQAIREDRQYGPYGRF